MSTKSQYEVEILVMLSTAIRLSLETKKRNVTVCSEMKIDIFPHLMLHDACASCCFDVQLVL